MSIDRNKKLSFATRSVHAGYDSSANEGSLNPPIYMTSTYAFDSVAQGAGRFSGEEKGHFYSRISNPTQEILETRWRIWKRAKRHWQPHQVWVPSPPRSGH